MKKKALLFDLNGTMIDDMKYHIIAWHRILNELGANLSMERVKEECYGKNDELLERIFPGRFTEEEKRKMSFEKEKQYQQQFRPHLRLLPGLDQFLKQAYASKIYMAIGSAAIPYNIDFVVDYFQIRHYFGAIVSADDVRISKPDPETFLICARKLNVDPADCIVLEDAPKGVEAAARAGMKAVVITTMHEAEEFAAWTNVLFASRDFLSPQIQELLD
ncbi:MAG: HAD family phosphatase [Chitinophagaceae bacterium]|jgi:beta-phosphoglucomutase family hydrolase|nr:HAD family phosphatase [Chitinophagaceae bacterium]